MIDEYKYILEKEKVKGKDVYPLLGVGYGSYRAATMPSKKRHPLWVRAFVLGYKLAKGTWA